MNRTVKENIDKLLLIGFDWRRIARMEKAQTDFFGIGQRADKQGQCGVRQNNCGKNQKKVDKWSNLVILKKVDTMTNLANWRAREQNTLYHM